MYGTQSSFLRHGPCEGCGSRDNVAWYSNGTGFCFGCGKFYRDNFSRVKSISTTTESFSSGNNGSGRSSESMENHVGPSVDDASSRVRPPPDDIGNYYPATVFEWVRPYGFTAADLVRYNVKWSPSREQLIYLFYGEGTEVVLWQARNFRSGTTHKTRYFTGGTPERVIASYSPEQGTGETAIVVEDCASAIKLAKSGYTGIPCFGSKVSPEKIRRICAMYPVVHWWLDDDMFKAAVKQANQCKLLGAESRVISTYYDPKEYQVDEVKDILKDMRYAS